MNKFINNEKNKSIDKRKLAITAIFFLVLISFGIGYLALAADDVFAGKMTITNTSVVIKDGTPNTDGNFDANNDAGNDSSDSNKIVRNFDTITYNVAFKLDYKSDYTGDKPEENTRNVDIHVYIPDSINASVTASISDSPEGASESSKNPIEGYKHYIISRSNIPVSNISSANNTPINVTISDAKNGDTILPIIKVQESTDDVALSNVSSVLTNNDKVTVSAAEKYSLKLYPGTVKKDENTGISTIPVGVLLYLPNDSNKGIKGIQIPSSTSFNIDIKYTQGSGLIESGSTIVNYDGAEYTVPNLPLAYATNNGKVGSIDSSVTEGYDSTKTLNYTELKYNTGIVNLNEGIENSEQNNVYYISSKVFVVKAQKLTNSDTKIKFKAGTSEIEIEDNYEAFVGEYISKIDFINESNIEINQSQGVVSETSGEAMYNYNESFYIQDTITYAEKSGDVLENGFTNYIKIDNETIKLINVDNSGNSGLDYYIELSASNENQNVNTTGDNLPFKIQYGTGEWKSSNFKIKSGAPSYCPITVPSNKEQLMNLYGGPCIEENTNSIKWYDSLDAVEKAKLSGNIILFKYDFTDKYYPATKTIIRLKGQVLSNVNNIGKTTQIVSRGITNFNNKVYYLSETPRISVSNQGSDLNYKKSVYDVVNKVYSYKNEPNGKYGNTILVTPFKTEVSTVIKDNNDSEKNEIYSGITDPLTIEIIPKIYKSAFDAIFTAATINVYLPVELELDIQKGDKSPISLTPTQEIIDGKLYNKYIYKYTETDIKYGDQAAAIDTLKLHAYVNISTVDSTDITVISIIDASMKTSATATSVYNSIVPIEYRTSKNDIRLRNTKIIGTIGKVSTSYFERNGSINYNMRAANSSGKTADLTLLKVLPYNGDGLSDGSQYSGTISIKLNETLPQGYEVYYTKSNANTIINNELNSSSLNSWVKWTNYTTSMTGITAIKITGPSLKNNEYFVSESGINISIMTSNNQEGDEYYNNFYILQKGVVNCEDELSGGCSSSTDSNTITPYASNISYSSIYNRSISGYAFEDYNYDGFYSNDEVRLEDIPVEIYKLSSTEIKDSKDPLSVISNNDKLVAQTTTDKNGSYKVKGLAQGNYYVKYTFDCEKYIVTEKNKQDQVSHSDTTQIDSDASMVPNTCTAVSNIITLNNDNVNEKNIDLGLRIRKNFDITIKKYITNVTINSTKGTQSYDYDNETKVKIDVKNLKNTTFRVTYKFVIENSKYFPGTIGQIVETIPEGMTFDPTLPENDGWYMSDNYLYYANYSNTLILPDEKYYMTIVLDLKTDSGGEYVNIVAAQDLKIMDTTVNLLDGIEISGASSDLNTTNTEEE